MIPEGGGGGGDRGAEDCKNASNNGARPMMQVCQPHEGEWLSGTEGLCGHVPRTKNQRPQPQQLLIQGHGRDRPSKTGSMGIISRSTQCPRPPAVRIAHTHSQATTHHTRGGSGPSMGKVCTFELMFSPKESPVYIEATKMGEPRLK